MTDWLLCAWGDDIRYVERYFENRTAKLPTISEAEWRFFHLMNGFRSAAIVHGVGARSLSGSGDKATDPDQYLSNYRGNLQDAVGKMNAAAAATTTTTTTAAGSKL